MSHRYFLFILVILVHINCTDKSQKKSNETVSSFTLQVTNPQTRSLLGSVLRSPPPSAELTKKWQEKRLAYEQDSFSIDNIIWLGRFTAYMGDYVEAINIYTRGINEYPDEPKLYRHRGHRYITLRRFQNAIEDLQIAKDLIQGTDNEIEPDGMPNAQNIPVSTLHGNIYYHLGLAYYLINDMENALSAYQSCLETSQKPDNVVSAVHWLYSILIRMGREEEANQYLKEVDQQMNIIENFSYHSLCLFYKNQITEDDLLQPLGSASANDAVQYGIANWKLMHGEKEEAIQILSEIVHQENWPSFGFIAAEADLARGLE